MKLDSYLEKHGLSAAAFARLIGASRSAVGRWLSGERMPEWKWLGAIEAATKGAVRPNDFSNGNGA